MDNDELKKALQEHVSLRIDVHALDGVRASLYWDDELLSVTVSPQMETKKPREIDDLLNLWEIKTIAAAQNAAG